MKAKFTLIVFAAILFGGTSIARLANSDTSANESIAAVSTAVIILALFGFFLFRLAKTKQGYLKEARLKYNAAYLCMVESDLNKTYILASTDSDILLLSNNKKLTTVVDLQRKFIDITVTDNAPMGFRKGRGILISTKAGLTEEIIPSTSFILLDDTNVVLSRPLKGEDVIAAHIKLTR